MKARVTRRDFITLLGGAVAPTVLRPRAACAQQERRVRRVGLLLAFRDADAEGTERLELFRRGLAGLGWVEGRNLRIDVRWAGAEAERWRSLARELVALTPDVIVTHNFTTTQELRDATTTIPIVFVGLNDPVASGLVSNLARPEANVTGFMQYEYSLAGKWLSLLKDMAPQLVRVALLFPGMQAAAPLYVRAAQNAGARLALRITTAGVRGAAGIEPAIAAMAGSDDGGLLVLPGVFNTLNRATTIELAAKYRVPAIYPGRSFVSD